MPSAPPGVIPAVRTQTPVDWLLAHGEPVDSVGLPQGKITLVTYDDEGQDACLAWLSKVGRTTEIAHARDLYVLTQSTKEPLIIMRAPVETPDTRARVIRTDFYGHEFNRLVPKLAMWLRRGPGFVFYGHKDAIPRCLRYYASVILWFDGPRVTIGKTVLSARGNRWLIPSEISELPPGDLSQWPSEEPDDLDETA